MRSCRVDNNIINTRGFFFFYINNFTRHFSRIKYEEKKKSHSSFYTMHRKNRLKKQRRHFSFFLLTNINEKKTQQQIATVAGVHDKYSISNK